MRLLTFALAACSTLALAQSPIQVIYTGKLLGYTRLPDIEQFRLATVSLLVDGKGDKASLQPKPCRTDTPAGFVCIPLFASDADRTPNQLAAEFQKQLLANRTAGAAQVLVGTGDNFGVDFYSRMAVMEGKGYIPKDELLWIKPKGASRPLVVHLGDLKHGFMGPFKEDQISGKSVIDTDNVAQFFTAMHYDALVPGKHDFYFGPERVRHLGRLLTKGKTTLLGANLVIKSTYAATPLPKADFLREPAFVRRAGEMRWDLPLTPLPWMRAIRIRNAWKNDTPLFAGTAFLGIYESGDNPDHLPKPLKGNCTNLAIKRIGQTSDGTVQLAGKDNACLYQTPIPAERTYAICVNLPPDPDPKAQPPRPLCQPFDVATPLLQYPDYADATHRGGQAREKARAKTELDDVLNGGEEPGRIPPWHARKDGIIIFGAVAAGMESAIGLLNLRWWNKDPNVETMVTTSDPTEALLQQLAYCKELLVCREDSTLLLLAQMPRDGAQIVNSRLGNPFKLVVAQADRMLATEQAAVTYKAGHRPVVVVPDEHVEKDVFQFGLQQAVLTKKAGDTDFTIVTEGLSGDSVRVQPLEDEKVPCLAKGLTDHASKLAGKKPEEQFHWLTLDSMREHAQADVAILQDRDFFKLPVSIAGCRTKPDGGREKQATIEHILWKGDFVVKRPITGASLLATLRESERFQRLEADIYTTQAEKGRWLRTLGVQRDGTTWYVNGKPVEANASYTVAMSDYLAFGDTGYADLRDGAITPPPRIRQLRSTPRIAELVAEKFGVKNRELDPEAYYDHSDHKPFLGAPRASLADQFAAQFRVNLSAKPDRKDVVNRLSQSRNYRRFFIDKAEIGGSRYRHNLGPNPASKFGDSPEAALGSQNKFNIAFSLQAEYRKEMERNQLFLRNEIDLTRESVQNAEGYALNFPQNRLTLEAGWRRAFNNLRQTPRLSLLLSSNLQMQPQTPQKYYRLSLQCTKACEPGGLPANINFRSDIGRSTRLNGKFGIRGEGAASWIEAGAFVGGAIRPIAYAPQFKGKTLASSTNAEVTPEPCFLSTFTQKDKSRYPTLASCLAQFAFHLTYPEDFQLAYPDQRFERPALRYQRGWVADTGFFVNFNWRLKLPPALVFSELAIENRGQYFINHAGKTLVDPVFSESLRIGPTLPLTRSLSLKPTYTVFFYNNRVDNMLLRSGSIDLKIEYRFDRGSGMSWLDALRYGRPR